MKRRNFIRNSSLVLGSVPFAALANGTSAATVSGSAYYYSQSGLVAKDAFVHSGLLKSSNVQYDEGSIVQLRVSLDYRTQIRYSSNDKYKVEFTKAVLRHFAESSSMSFILKRSFHAMVGSNNISKAERGRVRSNNIRQLAETAGASANDVINVKAQYSYGSGRYFHEENDKILANPIEDRIYYEQNLLQLSSFICSIIRAEINGDRQNPVNATLTSFFKNVLGVQSLTDANTNKIQII